ncbi:uncharacterized protein LOC135168996 [Diachasmimorpha longicaudata]|uniref:uncharacterized protein LOC135168996 n=1 Tax=Diachasmimorpha longicaudata TaxID=58733 RepID=UPI0030B89227
MSKNFESYDLESLKKYLAGRESYEGRQKPQFRQKRVRVCVDKYTDDDYLDSEDSDDMCIPAKARKIAIGSGLECEVEDFLVYPSCVCKYKFLGEMWNKIHIRYRRDKLHSQDEGIDMCTTFKVCYNEEPAESNKEIESNFQMRYNPPSLRSIAIANLLNERKYAKNAKTLAVVTKAIVHNSDVLLYKMSKSNGFFDCIEHTRLCKAGVGEKLYWYYFFRACEEEYYLPAGEETLVYKKGKGPIIDLSFQ